MFGGADGGFNPDLLSGRLEEMLPVIQQVVLSVNLKVVEFFDNYSDNMTLIFEKVYGIYVFK